MPFLWPLLPPHPHPSPLHHHRALSWALCYTGGSHSLSISHMDVFVNLNLPIHPTLPFPSRPWRPQVHSLCLRLYSWPAKRFICTKCNLSLFFNAMWRDFDSSSKGLTTKSQCSGSLTWGQVVLFLRERRCIGLTLPVKDPSSCSGLYRCYLPTDFLSSIGAEYSGLRECFQYDGKEYE